MEVFLIRHPRPLIDAGVCYGCLDIDAEDPTPIVRRLRSLLPPSTPVMASPLRRTRTLAEALHAQPQFDSRLREIDFGAWEGRRWEEIGRSPLDAWANDLLDYAPPGGESAAMLQKRVVACLSELSTNRVAVVTHAGPIRALLGHWLQLPVSRWSTIELAFGSVTRIKWAAGSPTAHTL